MKVTTPPSPCILAHSATAAAGLFGPSPANANGTDTPPTTATTTSADSAARTRNRRLRVKRSPGSMLQECQGHPERSLNEHPSPLASHTPAPRHTDSPHWCVPLWATSAMQASRTRAVLGLVARCLAWSDQPIVKASQNPRFGPYPPPLTRYPVGVFSDPGILHRNSGTKSRALALAVVVTLKRRDLLCTGGILGPVSLGRGPLAATRSRDASRRGDRPSSSRSDTPSSLARCHFRLHEVVRGKRLVSSREGCAREGRRPEGATILPRDYAVSPSRHR
jgi:hypothetical protein